MAETGLEIVYWIVFVLYLTFLALAGYYAKKKTKTLEDFMVASRKIGPLLLGLSFGVTYFSAVMIVGGGVQSWLWGLGVLWIASIDVLVGVFLVFVLFGSRTRVLGKHFNSMTVPQFLAKRYNDSKVQTFTSIIILVFETVYLVSIYMGLSILMSVLMPGEEFAYLVAVILCGIITIFYLNVGGSHGAIFTDAAESLIMFIGVILIFIAGIIAVGGISGLLNGLAIIEQSQGMKEGALRTFPGAGGMGLIGYILVTSFGVWGMPQMISRFYTAEKQKSIRWGLFVSCFWAFAVAIFAWFNGAISRVYYTMHDPSMIADGTVNPDNSVPMLMKAVLHPILAGLFLAAVTAASLTTGEKVIIMAASSFSIDVYQAKTGCSDDTALKVTKITTTTVVVIAVILAIFKPDAVLALCMFAWSVMAAVILIPYVFGLFWKGGTSKGALYSGAVAFIVAILWKVFFRGASLWAMVGASDAYATYMVPLASTVILTTDLMTITIGSIHEFIVSQIIALIAFPIISLLTPNSKPSEEFLTEIFNVFKSAKKEA